MKQFEFTDDEWLTIRGKSGLGNWADFTSKRDQQLRAAIAAVLESRESKPVNMHSCSKCGKSFGQCSCPSPTPDPQQAQAVGGETSIFEDTVEEMCAAYNGNCSFRAAERRGMTAALAVANKHRDAQWAAWGIVEVAVRNQSVAEYMNHWEGRAVKAENDLESLLGRVYIKEEVEKALRKHLGADVNTPQIDAILNSLSAPKPGVRCE